MILISGLMELGQGILYTLSLISNCEKVNRSQIGDWSGQVLDILFQSTNLVFFHIPIAVLKSSELGPIFARYALAGNLVTLTQRSCLINWSNPLCWWLSRQTVRKYKWIYRQCAPYRFVLPSLDFLLASCWVLALQILTLWFLTSHPPWSQTPPN